MKKWLTIIPLLCTCYAKTQVLHTLFQQAYNSPAACSRDADASSFLVNPAALPQLKQASMAFYSEQKFLLKELSGGSAALAFPAAGGSLGVVLGVTGFSGYSNAQLGVAYGRALDKRISLGVQINYHLVHTAGYGNSSATGFELGCIIHATGKLFAGIRVSNPVGGRYGRNPDDKLPASYTMALGIEASENLILYMHTKKTENQPVDFLLALQYNFVRQFFARAGTTVVSNTLFAGAGLRWKTIRLDLIGNYHFQLGATPALQLIMQLQNGGP